MSTTDLTINAEQTGLAYTSDLNDALAALDTCHSGPTAPTTQLSSGKFWLDTSETHPVLKIYRSGWKALFTITTTGVDTTLNSISATGTITAADFNTTSDKRLKSNIKTLNSESALEKVKELTGVYYEMNGKQSVGLIAQDVENVVPEVVIEREDGYKGVSYSNLVAVLIEAIKEQDTKITALENRLLKLEES